MNIKVKSFLLVTVCFNPYYALAASDANICEMFLKNPIFTKTTTNLSTQSNDDFRRLQCSASWGSAQEAQKAGIDAAIPLYGLTIPFTASWDSSKIGDWKNKNCTEEEKSSDYVINFYQSVVTINPITAKAAADCIANLGKNDTPASLRCNLTETQNFLMFEAEWRKTPGEPLDAAPVVENLTVMNTECKNADALSHNSRVTEGGVALLCDVQQLPAAFSLNTDRGKCFVSSSPRLPKIILPVQGVLDSPLFISGNDVEIPAEAKIITNGKPITIIAERLIIGSGSKIISFEPRALSQMEPGRYASPIRISAKEVIGKGLMILNAGEDGGPGSIGTQGPPGNPGAPGKPRITQFSKDCKNILGDFVGGAVCNLVPSGCGGGENGQVGGKGGAGYPGMPGAPGGGAAPVTIDFPIAARDSVMIYTDTDLTGAPRNCHGLVCGGLGGAGGIGGPGGDGGPGGVGASGTTYCGGTNPGPLGPRGEQGSLGLAGQAGVNGSITFN